METEELSTKNLLVNVEQKETIKLIRNSKGYTWEIKVIGLEVEKLEKINDDMLKKFGGQTI